MEKKFRVCFVRDTEAEFEECNGEARPLTETEYKENAYRSCPLHLRAGTKVITLGPPQAQGCAECGNIKYQDIPYAEYLAYYGNPDMHLYIGAIVEVQEGIEDWKVATSLWNIDIMTDDPALQTVTITEDTQNHHWYSPDDAIALPGYFGELAKELLTDTKD